MVSIDTWFTCVPDLEPILPKKKKKEKAYYLLENCTSVWIIPSSMIDGTEAKFVKWTKRYCLFLLSNSGKALLAGYNFLTTI